MTSPNELEFYAQPSPMTDMTACPPDALDGLPGSPVDLMKVVRGCVITADMFPLMHQMPAPTDRDAENQIRPVAEMVERIQELDPSPLVRSRAPQQRFIGNCRHFATFSCALLRLKGIPARVRAGFAGYFSPGTWADHWIIEYRRDGVWVRVDPQLDDAWLASAGYKATAERLAQRMYWTGAEAWQRCRQGELDPATCNMGGVNWGIGEVRGSVLLDLAAINKQEMLPWDTWGRMVEAYRSETDAAYDELLDDVSEVVVAGDVDAIRDLYESNEDLQARR